MMKNLGFLGVAIFVAAITLNEQATSAQDDAGDWGHLSGQIVVDGELKPIGPEPVGSHADKAVCLVDGDIPLDDNILVNEESKGLKNVFVYMYLKNKPDAPIHSSYETAKTEPVVLDNVKCRFVPYATFVRTGQNLVLKNSDPVGHNCHITTMENEHNVNLPPNGEVELTLDNADKRPGNVTCDLHKWMDSVIFTRDNPYVAITDENGKFTMENLPAGEWEFQFWHKKVGYLKKLEINNVTVSRKGVAEVSIKSGETTDLGTAKLPADAIRQ